jgi:phosphotriesterase-related protein
MRTVCYFYIYVLLLCIYSCKSVVSIHEHLFVSGQETIDTDLVWLSHEHILVDFIGADLINSNDWNDEEVIDHMIPYLEQLKKYKVKYFVDATPQYLGRDVELLDEISKKSGIKIMTNTGLYAAVDNKYIPNYAYEKSAEELADMWISEFRDGIDGTGIRPGFIKISVNDSSALRTIDAKIVEAAAITHRETGLTIGSHTGPAKALWPQLDILMENGVSPEAFIWIHAQNEDDLQSYLRAAEMGCWISLDGIGWELDNHLEKILFAKENQILDHILISHDAGWYDPQKKVQNVKPYTNIFEKLIPALLEEGFTNEEIGLLLSQNPSRCFKLEIKLL